MLWLWLTLQTFHVWSVKPVHVCTWLDTRQMYLAGVALWPEVKFRETEWPTKVNPAAVGSVLRVMSETDPSAPGLL